ncbi:ATP-binding cassette sub-family A member 9, partial [Chaetura pelagica]
MELWRQQVCAIGRVRFLKLKQEGKFLRSILLFFGIFILPILTFFLGFQLWETSSAWEILASSYFLTTEDKTQIKLTNLLILNDTGSEIEDIITALKTQNIMPEVSLEKNITSIPLHNGAIKISLEDKVPGSLCPLSWLFSEALAGLCSSSQPSWSTSLLRLFNSTARIRVWSDPFDNTKNPEIRTEIFLFCLSYMMILAAGLPPQFVVSSREDYKLQARAQLRLAGLFPSAYWCGQALVDVPVFWVL